MSVDLPEPDGPMTALNPPRGNSTLTPLRAATAVPPVPYVLTSSCARAASVVVVVIPRHEVVLADGPLRGFLDDLELVCPRVGRKLAPLRGALRVERAPV